MALATAGGARRSAAVRPEGGGAGQTHVLRTRAEPGRSPAQCRVVRMRAATSGGGSRRSRSRRIGTGIGWVMGRSG